MRFIDRYWGWLFLLAVVCFLWGCTPLICKHKQDDPICKEETHDD